MPGLLEVQQGHDLHHVADTGNQRSGRIRYTRGPSAFLKFIGPGIISCNMPRHFSFLDKVLFIDRIWRQR